MNLPRILSFAREMIEGVLQEGDIALDGTVGNGHDALFLAQQVGKEGKVYGFDVQKAALESARTRLEEAGAEAQVELLLAGHETLENHLPEEQKGHLKAAMFNLGYLPGSDKARITHEETTLPALEATLRMLSVGGLMSVVLYPGHEGGDQEADAVLTWARQLDSANFDVLLYDFINRQNKSPILLIFQKKR